MPHEIMRFLPEVDVGVVGEAFVTFPESCAELDAGSATGPPIDGLISRDPAGAHHG